MTKRRPWTADWQHGLAVAFVSPAGRVSAWPVPIDRGTIVWPSGV